MRYTLFALLVFPLCLCAQPGRIKPPTKPTPTPAPATPAKPTTGTLSITSSPSGAAVKVDGKYKGETPLTLERQKPGSYTITFSAEGYESKTQSVTVTAGKTVTCSAKLKKKTVKQPVSATTSSSSSKPQNTATHAVTASYKDGILNVNGVQYKMLFVEGGTFQMGATPEQNNPRVDEKPVHGVTLSSYYIGQTEVTQALWHAVMGTTVRQQYQKILGKNTLLDEGEGDNYPMYYISWEDCQTFITKLNKLTGRKFRLPTEAEWEFAARGGNKSKGYRYSGSNSLGEVAWYGSNSDKKTHPVSTKQPNELGIYDMSGNVSEWCQDWYGKDYYQNASSNNPMGPITGSDRVYRGGSWFYYDMDSRVSYRNRHTPSSRFTFFGLRLAMSCETQNAVDVEDRQASDGKLEHKEQDKVTTPISSGDNTVTAEKIFTVNGISLIMKRVEGGTFCMDTISEQSNPNDDEKSVHNVTLSSYYIGSTEVTQALWEAVMGSNPSGFKGDNLPVENVSWKDCQKFITKLNQLTGQKFRLPTEAEWEYAARGGNKSKGYKFCGSNTLDDVAWYEKNSDGKTHPVASKLANELDIFDMNGNVREWCQDWHGDDYPSSSVTNPTGPAKGYLRIDRGGGWNNDIRFFFWSSRHGFKPSDHYNGLGLRLAL